MKRFAVTCITAVAAMFSGCANMARAPVSTTADPGYEPVRAPIRLALVLSAGNMRGFAHVGVIRELKAHGIEPDLIVGSSAGAMVGAIAASGASPAELEAAVDAIDPGDFLYLRTPWLGLIGGDGIHDFVDRNAKLHRIEQFPIRFAAVAVDAERSCLQIFNTGDPGKAVQASSTIPVLISPPRISGRQYLDGALISPMPVHVARALGAERVIAVDVTFEPSERPRFSIVEAFWRTSLVSRWALAVGERSDADYVIKPTLLPEAMINLGSRRQLVEAGAEAVRRELPAIREALRATPIARAGDIHPALSDLLCPDIRLRLKTTQIDPGMRTDKPLDLPAMGRSIVYLESR